MLVHVGFPNNKLADILAKAETVFPSIKVPYWLAPVISIMRYTRYSS